VSDQKLDLILATLQALNDRVARSEGDSAAALDSVKTIAQKLAKQPAQPPASDYRGIGLAEALALIQSAEDRTTSRITEVIKIVNESHNSAQKSFMEGLAMGQSMTAETDSDGDGTPDYLEILTQLQNTFSRKRGATNGISPQGVTERRLEAVGNGAPHDGENL
jgi:hypothetical protein